MSKYIIELKDDVQVVQKVGVTENGNAFVMNFYKDQLEELTADYINEHYGDLQDDAYNKGYAQCQDDYSDALKHAKDTAYKRGLEDGKAVNGKGKGCAGCEYAGKVVTGPPCITCSNSYKNQWTATDDEIKVGDEVAFHHDDGRPDTVVVVTYIGQDGFIDGMDGRGTQYAHKNPTKWTKTGRHFGIASILKEMQS